MSIADNPEQRRAYDLYVIACELRNQGDEAGAIKAISEAMEIRPKNALYVFAKGTIEKEFGRLKEATVSFATASRMRPQWSDPITALGLIAYDEDLFQVAKRFYEHAVSLEPDVDGYTILANIYLNENPAESLRYANLALAIDPEWEEAVNLRADALKKLAEDRSLWDQ